MAQSKRNRLFGLTLLASAAGLASACAGAPPPPLKDARAAYHRASTGPAKELAPAQLHAARTVLNLAEKTYEDEGDSPNARDRAYVAMRKSELAEVHAQIARANQSASQIEERGELAEQQQHAAVAESLTQTRDELAAERARGAVQSSELKAETERRQLAEQAQAQALSALAAKENVKQEDRGTVITLSGSVIFPSGGSDLLPSARNKLSDVATALSQDGAESKIIVEGHTDSVGSENMNMELSENRAASVRDWLVAQGVPAERITVSGFGASRPVADNTSPAGRANNRRVEIVVQPSAGKRTSQQERARPTPLAASKARP